MKISKDCKYYRGDVPCIFHKQEGVKCKCKHYIRRGKRILIIKLGSIGDVIRTTPLLRKLWKVYPNCEITWITYNPEVVPKLVDQVLNFDKTNIVTLLGDKYDILYNLDKGKEACALTNLVKADVKKGFKLVKGKCEPIDKDVEHFFYTGVNDDLNKKSIKSYVEEIFWICGLCYSKEKYLLEKPKCTVKLPNIKKPVIGLNTGCGKRWITRLWPEKKWVDLARNLVKEGYSVLLLGGDDENEKNIRIAKESKAKYLGVFSLLDFINVIDKCDLIVTSVTMAMHIAIGLEKKMVLLNNIFNKNEFELYGLGEIIEPNVECKMCFKRECAYRCMEKITVDEVLKAIKRCIRRR